MAERKGAAGRLVRGLIAAVLVAAPVWACGPFFPERMLLNRSAKLLEAPRSRFGAELDALPVKAPAGLKASWTPETEHDKQTAEVDAAELLAALAGKEKAAEIVERYRSVRGLLKQNGPGGSGGKVAPALASPAGIPAEFDDYLQGAIALSRGDTTGARAAWQRLLARPAEQRRFKSTWAAYMLGKSFMGDDAAQAVRWFEETRRLAAAGFRDPLGLSASSLSYQGQVELERGRFGPAARLYLEANATRDPSAAASLRMVCWKLLKADARARSTAVKDAAVRQVLLAHLVSSRDLAELKKDSVEVKVLELLQDETRGERDVEGAERLAWIAYQRGDWAGAAAWVKRAREGPVASWIRSKLLARQGKLDEAARALAKAVEGFPIDGATVPPELDDDDFGGLQPARRLRGELAVLKLSRRQFVDALDLLLRASYWRDAAFVAERALSVEELKAYVDEKWPEPREAPVKDGEARTPGTAERLRYLLARRLARLGQWKEAKPYFPKEFRPRVDMYTGALAESRDRKLPAEQRAGALWLIAKMERKEGLELIGTEVAPDWHVDEGQFDEDTHLGAPVAREKLPVISDAERQRARKNAPTPGKRFHYRYVAAEHALEASRLLPASSSAARDMLCQAHGWLKSRDPKAAGKYIKELRGRGMDADCS